MLDPAIVAAYIRETARLEILPRFRALGGGDVREKRPGDLVTVADLEAERRLTGLLETAAPGTLVIGEEGVAQEPARLERLRGAAPLWLVDPVDGTSNFANGRPGFAVIVAYVEGGATRAGWIYDPLDDVMVTAMRGGGAWRGDERLRVAAAPPRSMIGSAYGRNPSGARHAEALARSGRVGTVRNHRCSGLEYAAIALGREHFSLHSRSLPWDHAAGMLLVAEAGGTVAFLDGSAYDPRIADRPLLAAASAEGWRVVRDVVRGAGSSPP
jgi:fructose-1,6-bisphosphatase/inositol monophosphatase family enzyme